MKSKKLVFVLLVLIGLCAVLLSGWGRGKTDRYRTVPATRGDLFVSINATGTVEPEEVIDVGAQVAGQILSFGKDRTGKTIDYGSEVDEGTVLAQIDDSLYLSDVAQAEAQLARAKADLEQTRAKLFQAERDWKRAEDMGPSEGLSRSSYDSFKAGYEGANAALGVAAAMVSQADAALMKAKRNLGYCVIKSPVKGVIIDRRVNIGQTVVSSLNAPSLFLIAKDLRRMQVWVSVNEADIGSIRTGQTATFSVDAFPGENFAGEVGKIRLNATMVQNVVTYIVEVITDNSSGRLLPYLTANVEFEVSSKENAVLVPNAALRWFPREGDQSKKEDKPKVNTEKPPGGDGKDKAAGSVNSGTVWVLEDDEPKQISVEIGGSDGAVTEIVKGDLSEGTPLIIGEIIEPQDGPKPGGTSPFAPQVMRGRRNR